MSYTAYGVNGIEQVVDVKVNKELYEKIENIKLETNNLIKLIENQYIELNRSDILSKYSEQLSLENITHICSENITYEGNDGYSRPTGERRVSTFFYTELLDFYKNNKHMVPNLEMGLNHIFNIYDGFDTDFIKRDLYLLANYKSLIYNIILKFEIYKNLSENSKNFILRDKKVIKYENKNHSIISATLNYLKSYVKELDLILRHYTLSNTNCENFGLNMCNIQLKDINYIPVDFTYGNKNDYKPNTSYQLVESLLYINRDIIISEVLQKDGVINFLLKDDTVKSYNEIKTIAIEELSKYNEKIDTLIKEFLTTKKAKIQSYTITDLDSFLSTMYDIYKDQV